MGNSLTMKKNNNNISNNIKNSIKTMILSDIIYKQHSFIFQLEEEWCNYYNNPEVYIKDLIKEANEHYSCNTIFDILFTVLSIKQQSVILYETNDIMTDEPIDLLIGIRILSDEKCTFRIYCCEDIFLGEYMTCHNQKVIRLNKIIPNMMLRILNYPYNIKIQFTSENKSEYRFIYGMLDNDIRKYLLQNLCNYF